MISTENNSRPHLLLMALGTQPKRTTYALGDKTTQSEHAPLAWLRLQDPNDRPDKVLCLLTKKARETVWEDFARQVESLGVRAEGLDIPDGDNSEQLSATIRNVANNIAPASRLTLDITHGPRHIPFVFYALALYLSSFRNVEIVDAWYGKYESQGDTKPLIDLKPLLDLPQWFHAVRVFRETGFTKALAARFEDVKNSLPKDSSRGPSQACAEALGTFSYHYESGFPLELGLAAGKLSHALEDRPLDTMPSLNVPLAKELGEAVLEAAAPLRFESDDLKNGKSKSAWKKLYPLSREELRRQAKLIDQYLDRGQFSAGVGLMREWVVSLGVLHRDPPKHWLDRPTRMKIERELGAMNQPALRDSLSDEQKSWGTFWDQLGKERNQLAHHGMKQDVAKPESNLSEQIQSFWYRIKGADDAWESFGGSKGRLLITPVGMSPGVLYSAIKQTRPNSVLVLCSEQAKPGINEALQRTGFSGTPNVLGMKDPFNGASEIKALLQQTRKNCLDADEVLVNLTGGTTLMGVVVQQLFEQARNDQRLCRRFILADRRTQEEQKVNPWVESELFWLDKEFNGDEGND